MTWQELGKAAAIGARAGPGIPSFVRHEAHHRRPAHPGAAADFLPGTSSAVRPRIREGERSMNVTGLELVIGGVLAALILLVGFAFWLASRGE
jgi:hypothetical protein